MTGVLSAADYDEKLLLPASWPAFQLRVCQLRPEWAKGQGQVATSSSVSKGTLDPKVTVDINTILALKI